MLTNVFAEKRGHNKVVACLAAVKGLLGSNKVEMGQGELRGCVVAW